jgi:hypothetical protein
MVRLLVSSLLTLALLIAAVPALGAAASDATIEVHQPFDQPEGTFTADSDVLCASGTTSDVVRLTGNGSVINIRDIKTFTCADGSGTFTLKIQAQVRPCETTDQGAWTVIGGTGDYEQLRGAGTLVGTYFPNNACDAEGINDRLTGKLVLP